MINLNFQEAGFGLKSTKRSYENNISRSIRKETGLGKKTFTTNRVKCVNSMLKLDRQKDKLPSVDAFVKLARGVVSRQQRSVKMGIV